MKNQEYLKETYEWKDLLAIVHKLRQPDAVRGTARRPMRA